MTSTLPARAEPVEIAVPAPSQQRSRRQTAYVVLLVLLVAAGVAVRFISRGGLWLDEALSVDIASLAPGHLLAALKVDGSPPLYYLLLHAWMAVFGTGTDATRTLSGVLSVAALVPAWYLGKRLGGRPLAVATLVLLADAPFALRFGSETRMYSLVLLEVCLGGLALARALERPSWQRLAPVSLAVAALAYTHYWCFFLLVTCAIGLAVMRRWRVLAAFPAAAVLFVPWLPTFVFQLQHTGTPWAAPVQQRDVIDTLLAWGGPETYGWAPPLGLAMIVVGLVGAFAVRDVDGRLVLAPRRTPLGIAALVLSVGTLCVATGVSMVTHGGYVERYTAIAVPAYVLLVALGVTRLGGRTGTVVLVLFAVVGLVTGTADGIKVRTQAAQVAAEIATYTQAGDLVVYCPDQLAPAVHRVIPAGRTEISYGDDLGPSRIDWVDYAQRNAALDPFVTAVNLSAQAGPDHAIALVWADGYITFGGQCGRLAAELGALRPGSAQVVSRNLNLYENANVTVYPGADETPVVVTS